MTTLLLKNCACITMDEERPTASLIAIENERIVWVGDEEEIASWLGPNTQVLDLKGAFVYPGFIDSHAHIYYTGHVKERQINLAGMRSKEAILALVEAKAQKSQPNDWIMGIGWDEHLWPDSMLPTAADLDGVSPHNPVVLMRTDSHAVWVNSLVLQLAGIDAAIPDPEGGKIYRDSHDTPTGILLDNACTAILAHAHEDEDHLKLMQGMLKECLTFGITFLHDAAMSDEQIEACKTLAAQNLLPLRVYAMVRAPSHLAEAFLQSGPLNYGPFFEVHCIKFFMDGAMGSRGACLFEPYTDAPEQSGLLVWKEEDFVAYLQRIRKAGLQAACHAIGDKANHIVLNAYEKVDAKGLRFRIEHAQILAKDDIKRFAKLEVIASMQPLHMLADMPWIEKRIGKERIPCAFAFRSLLAAGAKIAGGSDSPIVDINPLMGIYAATTHQESHIGECISRKEALKMYTLDAAYASFREHELGSITKGKLADLVILPENILTCPADALRTMPVLYTIVNGKVCYKKA